MKKLIDKQITKLQLNWVFSYQVLWQALNSLCEHEIEAPSVIKTFS